MTYQVYNSTDANLKELVHNVQNNGYSLHFEQDLCKKKMSEVFKRIGQCETPGLFMNDNDNPEIFNVTGMKDNTGSKIGMFGDGELGWHSNGNSRHNVDKILIGLYCVQGDVNTTLSVCNTSSPYYNLTTSEQEYLSQIKIRIQFRNNTMYHLDEDDPELEFMSASRGSIRSLVGVHPYTNKHYFYFPYHFIVKAWRNNKQIDHLKLIDKLKTIIFRSRYQFHHVFAPGDLLLMDQFTTLHRRSPVMGDRLLWRVACDYTNIAK